MLTTTLVLFAGLAGGVAKADISITTTQFPGTSPTTVDWFFHNFPVGNFFPGSPADVDLSHTITGFGSATQIGFDFQDPLNSHNYIQSISLDNGHSINVGSGYLASFVGFTDTTAFTSITVTMHVDDGWSGNLADYRVAGLQTSAVPEPTSVILLGTVAGLMFAGSRRRLARNRG